MSSTPPSDFRSIRKLLPPEVFAISEGMDSPPTDLVRKEVWDGITHLPDDVALRTSGHDGLRLDILHTLYRDWVHAIGLKRTDEIFDAMLDAGDCFQSANFNFLHGFYRTSLADLRTAFELTMIGTFGQLNPNDLGYREWKSGASEFFGFGLCRKSLFESLRADQAKWLFEKEGLLARTFKKLCSFTHSRPDASDGALWESNGPVYKNEAIKLVVHTAVAVYALCHLLVRIARPRAVLPNNSEMIYELDWMPEHANLVRAYTELFGRPPKLPLKD